MDYLEYERQIKVIDNTLTFIGYIVDEYGKVYVPFSKSESEDIKEYHHDYYYFCLTKASRTLCAASELSKMLFTEDVMILSRAAYESYLFLANSINDIKFIKKSIILRLYLKLEKVAYLKMSNGKTNYNRVVELQTKKEFDYDLRISTLSKNTYCSLDKMIHRELYQYISEHTHNDFLGSGNFRNDSNNNYEIKPKRAQLQSNFIILYVIYLLMDSLKVECLKNKDYVISNILESEKSKIDEHIRQIREMLLHIVSELDFSYYSASFKDNLRNRINYEMS